MGCDAALNLAMDALVAGRAMPAEVAAHVRGCVRCQEGLHGLEEAWSALAALPLLTPSPTIGRRLAQRLHREWARRTLVSVESWKQAAVGGISAFVLAVILSLLLPFEAMVEVCRALAPNALPTPATYLLAGLAYGVLPMLAGAAVQRRWTSDGASASAIEAALVFLVVLVPYVVLRCGDFPLPLLAGFIAGIALGAAGGGAIGAGLRDRLLSA